MTIIGASFSSAVQGNQTFTPLVTINKWTNTHSPSQGTHSLTATLEPIILSPWFSVLTFWVSGSVFYMVFSNLNNVIPETYRISYKENIQVTQISDTCANVGFFCFVFFSAGKQNNII